MGKNLIDVILRLVDQLSPGYKKAAQEVSKGSEDMAKGSAKVAVESGKAAAATKESGEAAADAAPKRGKLTEAEKEAAASAKAAAQASKQAAKASDEASGAMEKVKTKSKEAGASHKEHSMQTMELQMGYMLLAGALTAVFAAMTSAVTKGIEANNKQVAAFTGLKSVVIGTGKDYDQARNFVQKFTEDGLISQAKAAEALKNLLARGFGLDEAIQMLTRLKDAAAFGKQAHLDMGQAVASATEGIKNENSILVDNAGVTKNVSIMWKEYAAQLGKGVQSLTQAEKRQAEFNGIMNETRHQAGDAAKLVNELGGQMSKAGQATEMAAAAFGKAWAPAVSIGAQLMTGLMNLVRQAAEKFPVLTFMVTALAMAVTGMTAAFVGWLAVAGLVKAAMADLAVRAGVMWAAITGPVGIAIAALAAAAGALYYLATAQERAAKAAVDSARKQEQAAKDVADAARNKVREIVRQEEQLQKEITDLEKQAADQRSDLAKKEREDRRQDANQLGEIILSALKKQHAEAQKAEERALDEQIDGLKQAAKERYDAVKQAAEDEMDVLTEQISQRKQSIQDAADIEQADLRKANDQAVDAWKERKERVQDAQRDEEDATKEHYGELRDTARVYFDEQRRQIQGWASEQEQAIRSVYDLRLRTLDAENDAAVGALEDQIRAIDAQTRAEDQAERDRRRNEKIASLELKALAASTAEEKLKIEKEISDLRAEAEREALLRSRDAQKAALQEQIEQVRQHANERKEALKEQQDAELEELRKTVEAKRKMLDEQHETELAQIKAAEKEALDSLERKHKEQIKALDTERQSLDEKLTDDLKRVSEHEKAELRAQDKILKVAKQTMEDRLAAEKETHEAQVAQLAELETAEKAAIHEKYHGPNGLLNEAKLYAEALKLLHEQNQQELLALLDRYEPDWKDQGKDFVQRLAEGGEEAKPAVDALAEAINQTLQAAAENVQVLREKAGDSAEKLAQITASLEQARNAHAEVGKLRDDAADEAREAERNLRMLQEQRLKAEQELKEIQEQQRQNTGAQGTAASGTGGGQATERNRGIDAARDIMNNPPTGSRHAGGPVGVTGAYRLLQGEHVLTEAQAKQYRAARLIDGSSVLSGLSAVPASGAAAGAAAGGPPVFQFYDSKITSEQDVERLLRQFGKRILDEVRRNTTPVR